jgi:hypothetical protein
MTIPQSAYIYLAACIFVAIVIFLISGWIETEVLANILIKPQLYRHLGCDALFVQVSPSKFGKNYYNWQPVRKVFWRVYVYTGWSVRDEMCNFERIK